MQDQIPRKKHLENEHWKEYIAQGSHIMAFPGQPSASHWKAFDLIIKHFDKDMDRREAAEARICSLLNPKKEIRGRFKWFKRLFIFRWAIFLNWSLYAVTFEFMGGLITSTDSGAIFRKSRWIDLENDLTVNAVATDVGKTAYTYLAMCTQNSTVGYLRPDCCDPFAQLVAPSTFPGTWMMRHQIWELGLARIYIEISRKPPPSSR